MKAIAQLVDSCETIADIGTDHGFLPIYLVEQQVCQSAIAMDINRGPLKRAMEHIADENMEDSITTRLSDGFENLQVGEVQTVIIAGMGGMLMESILLKGEKVAKRLKNLVLQPQSDFMYFRQFLFQHGYEILAEDMVFEDGKYYTVFKVTPNKSINEKDFDILLPEEKRYGSFFFSNRNQIFSQYLIHEREICVQVQEVLSNGQDTEKNKIRRQEIEDKLFVIQKAIERI